MDFSFISDRDFLRDMLKIALPVAFQQLITAGLNMVDVLMVGQLGEEAIAAVGLANQVFFVLILFLFGITSGMAIFTAQYWGKRDIQSIRLVLGMSGVVSAGAALLASTAALFAPESILHFYTTDPDVIALGSGYLRIVGLTYVLTAIANAYIAVLRSMEFVTPTVMVSVLALAFKTGISYLLIFGHWGLPALGVNGAAIGTVISWVIEILLLFGVVYGLKTPLAANPLSFLGFGRGFFFRVLRTVTPAAANELAWSLGITTYNAVYARIGTDAIAAVNVNATIENLAFVIFFGLGNACAVLVGNRIGAGKQDMAYQYGVRFMTMSLIGAVLIGLGILPLRGPVANLYALSAQGTENLRWLMLVFGLTLWLRVHNFILFVGTLRAGGDTRFAFLMELSSIWLVGVPAALIGGFVLKLPVYGVYLMVALEEVVKAVVIQWRFRSRKWINDLVNANVA